MPEVIVKWPTGERRYPVPDNFTYREMSRIKTMTGQTPMQLMEALAEGDADATIALTVVAIERAGETVNVDDLEGLPFGAITSEADQPAPDPTAAVPAAPDVPAEDGSSSQPTPESGGTPD
jgi:hypothetical protein